MPKSKSVPSRSALTERYYRLSNTSCERLKRDSVVLPSRPYLHRAVDELSPQRILRCSFGCKTRGYQVHGVLSLCFFFYGDPFQTDCVGCKIIFIRPRKPLSEPLFGSAADKTGPTFVISLSPLLRWIMFRTGVKPRSAPPRPILYNVNFRVVYHFNRSIFRKLHYYY